MKKINSYITAFVFTFCFLFAMLHSTFIHASINLSKKQMIRRIQMFYPLKHITSSDFKTLKKLVKKKEFSIALKEAEALYQRKPDDLETSYVLQAVKSYSLVNSKFRFDKNTPSPLLTFYAWLAFSNKNYDEAIKLTEHCIELYGPEALRQQGFLSSFAPAVEARNSWALNDVGTCLFIKGKSLYETGKFQRSHDVFKKISDLFSFSQCFDYANRTFWLPSDKAKNNIQLIASKNKIGTSQTEERTILAAKYEPEIKPEPVKQPPVIEKRVICKKPSPPPVAEEEKEILPNEDIILDPPPPPMQLDEPLAKPVSDIEEKLIVETPPPDANGLDDQEPEEVIITNEPITINDINKQQEDMKTPGIDEKLEQTRFDELIVNNDMEPSEYEDIEPDPEDIDEDEVELPSPAPNTLVAKAETEFEEEEESIPEAEVTDIAPDVEAPAKEDVVPITTRNAEIEKKIEPSKPVKIEEEEKPAPHRTYDPNEKRKLKEVLVYVKKGLTLKWTGKINKNGKYEALLKKTGKQPETLEFETIEDFYVFADELGFSR